MTYETGEQISLQDLGLWSGKMSTEPLAATKVKTSKPSSRRSSGSSNRKAPMCLCLTGGGKWSYSGCLYDYMGRWSVAWRVHDAQFWGVPQRRKRIALVADFGGLSAPEILFERKGLSGDFEQGEAEREEVAGSVGESLNPPVARALSRRHDGSYATDRGAGRDY